MIRITANPATRAGFDAAEKARADATRQVWSAIARLFSAPRVPAACAAE